MKSSNLALAILCWAAIACSSADEAVQKNTQELTADDFKDAVAKGATFIMFYAPWCGHCKALHPTWDQLATKYHKAEEKKVKIAAIDCDAHNKICEEKGVRGYPSLIFFQNGEETKYSGQRGFDELNIFVEKQLQAAVPITIKEGLALLDESNFDSHAKRKAANGEKPFTFVKFFSPGCGHCKNMAPAWAVLAKHFENSAEVSIAELDCTKSKAVCKSHEIRGYPTLKLFRGDYQEIYDGDRSFERMKDFVESKTKDAEKGEEPSAVPELTASSFPETIKEGLTFVKFYAPWCGHCKNMAPAWEELAKTTEDVKVVNVDCTKDKGDALCEGEGVKGFPTLILYKDGKKLGEEYEGSRKLEDIKTFLDGARAGKIEEKTETPEPTEDDPVKVLTKESFAGHINRSNEDINQSSFTFVKFYAPWCGHCKALIPVWETIGKHYEQTDAVSVSKVDCTKEMSLCQEYGIKSYPTLILFKTKPKTEGEEEKPEQFEHDKPRNVHEFTTFIEEHGGKIEVPEGPVKVLTATNFDAAISSSQPTFVKFFAPWCGHCKSMEPAWEQLATEFTDVTVAEVDCTMTENDELCTKQEITGYPSLWLYQEGDKLAKHAGARSFDGFKSFIIEMTEPVGESKVLSLTGSKFSAQIGSGWTFVEFYAPWCGHCKAMAPDWEKLADKQEDVKVAKVDCTLESNGEICKAEGADAYPTIFLYKDGKKVGEEFSGKRDLKGFVFYLIDYLGQADKTEEKAAVGEEMGVDDHHLIRNDFKAFIKNGVTLVNFYTPSSAECRKLFPALKRIKSIKAARVVVVDCSKESDVCTQEGIIRHPTLVLYKDGERDSVFSGERTYESLHLFLTGNPPPTAATPDAAAAAIPVAAKEGAGAQKKIEL